MIRNILFEVIILIFAFILSGKKSRNDKTILSFDSTSVLRGIAILMVMLGHMTGGLGSNIFTPLGGGGVAIFLILSGYGLSESAKKNLDRFWMKKIVSVLILWILIHSLFRTGWLHFNIWVYLGEITLIQTKSWYLQYLFLWYIIFYLYNSFEWLYKYRWTFMSICSIIIFLFWDAIQAEQAISFILGAWISYKKDSIQFSKRQLQKVFFVFLGASIFFLVLKQIPVIRNNFDNILLFHSLQVLLKTSIALCTLSGLYLSRTLLENRFLYFTGKISYELYLIHLFVIIPFMDKIGIQKSFLYLFLFFSSSYLLSWIFYLLNLQLKKYLLK